MSGQSNGMKIVGFVFIMVLMSATHAQQKSLYDRLGGESGARSITEEIWNNHASNPIVSGRFANSDPDYVKQKVFEILAASTGGPVEYTGKDMPSAHKGMNISDMEFNAVVDDVIKSLDMHNIGVREKNEVLAILWSVKDQIVNSNLTTKTLTHKPRTPQLESEKPSLFNRLGGETGARAIVDDIWTNHKTNPLISNRFAKSDPVYVKQKVYEILAASTGGPVQYTGKDMKTTHEAMNINDTEFNAVVDDVMQALEKHKIGVSEKSEVLSILWSVKDQVVNGELTSSLAGKVRWWLPK